MKLTDKLLRAANTSHAWSKPQLAVLGISYPVPSGWRRRIIGMEISDTDYQKLCELALVRVSPKKERPGIPDKPEGTVQIPDEINALVAQLTDKLELERVARAELEMKFSALQLRFDVLCNDVRETRRDHAINARDHAHALSQEMPSAPPWNG
jgi:hypothetical protein